MAKILVIDDDKFIVKAIMGVLKGVGHEVECAYDGEAGERAFDTQRFDAVICDMLMPEQEGLETIRHMRKAQPGTAIVAISGGLKGSNLDILSMAKQLGAHATLQKPFQVPQIVTAVDEALNCARATHA